MNFRLKTILIASMLLNILGVFGFLFGICGNHIAPIVLIIVGVYVYRIYQEGAHQLEVKSDVEAAILSGNTYRTRIIRTNLKVSGVERKLVIDQGNKFIPQRLIYSFETMQKHVRKYWSVDSFLQRINELTDRTAGSLAKLIFPESLRIRLVKYISGASPP